MDYKYVDELELYEDNDRFDDQGYAIFVDGVLQETVKGNLDHVVGKAEAEYTGLIEISDEYYDRKTEDVKFSDAVWSNT